MSEIEELDARIEQLAEEAKRYAREQMAHPLEPMLFSASVFHQRFTELIVQECIAVIEEQASHMHAKGTMEAITNLEKHFGVD